MSMIEIFDHQITMKEKVEKERAERFAKMLRIEQQRLRLEEERVQLEKVKEEREIMNMDLSHIDEDHRPTTGASAKALLLLAVLHLAHPAKFLGWLNLV